MPPKTKKCAPSATGDRLALAPTLSCRVVLAPLLAPRDCYSAFCSRRHILQIISLGISITSSPLRSNLLILFVQTLVASTLLQNLNLASLGRIGRNTSRQDIFGIARTVSAFSYDQCILDTVASLLDQAAFAKITLLHLLPFFDFIIVARPIYRNLK